MCSSNIRDRFRVLPKAIAIVFFGTLVLEAQSGGVITGSIFDQAAKAIPGANVTVRSESGSVSGTTTSGEEGRFSVSGLGAGTYDVEATAPGFARGTRLGVQVGAASTPDISITLNVDSISQSVTVQDSVLLAVETSPQGNTLDTFSAQTEISNAVITNFMAPVADFAEVIEQAPGAFSINPNGIGLGQGKSFFRGFKDGQYSITFDGIPFNDTNDPTHHSWASFPSQWISSADIDRSAGMPHDFGPTNYGGSVNLKSPELQADPEIRGTFTYGSFNTKLYSLDFESGLLGHKKQDAILFNINGMTSDGYQTNNFQQRDAGYGKYQHRFSDKTSLSLYGAVVDIWNNTPDTGNPTRDQVTAYDYNFLLTSTPLLPNGTPDPYYYGYQTYHVQTDFEYAGFHSDLGNGWLFDTKAYTTRYWNKQFLNKNPGVINLSTSKPGAVDKLNGYRHAGDTLILSKEMKWGIFRTGIWYDWAYTDRYQYQSNLLTQLDTPLPNFHEHFHTQSFQPFAEFEWHPLPRMAVTAGIKAADYKMNLLQYQDNGKTVGCLGGTPSKYPASASLFAGAPSCIGGAAFTTHSINYNSWLPTLAARYRVWRTWSLYAEFGEGSQIPPSAVFDVPGGNVSVAPKPTNAKTYQYGSVLKLNRFTLDMDGYYVHFQNGYSSFYDQNSAETVYFPTGPSNTKGFEAEGNVALVYGLSVYANLSVGSAKYQTGHNYANQGLWVANTPSDVEGGSLLWQHRNFDFGFTYKRVGTYYNDNGSVSQAIKISPFDLENAFLNYTIKNSSHFRGTKIQLAFNNIADHHDILGISPLNGPTPTVPYAPAGGDLLVLTPGRSISLTVTGGWAPRR